MRFYKDHYDVVIIGGALAGCCDLAIINNCWATGDITVRTEDGEYKNNSFAGGLIGFIGHALIDLSWGGIPWWSWVITSAFVGVVVGLFTKKLHVEEGDFNKKKVGVFALANVIANLIGWIVVAPVLDILIYAEPAKKVFAQGVFAGISNSITAVVVGGLLVLAYTKTIAKKGSLDKE